MCLVLMFWACIASAAPSVSRVEVMCCCARGGYLPLLTRVVVHRVLLILGNVKTSLFLNPNGVLYFQINISECCH